jgi:hypothetical protein
MLKKMILCGAILLLLSDADCMRTARPSPRPGVFRLVVMGKRHLASLASNAALMSHCYENFHSEEEKQTVLEMGDKYREEHPGCDHIVWGEVLSGTGIDPLWAINYYSTRKRGLGGESRVGHSMEEKQTVLERGNMYLEQNPDCHNIPWRSILSAYHPTRHRNIHKA